MASTDDQQAGVVEMAWDPITRVIGSLDIYTRIDFGQRKVIECHSTSSIFRGYSVLMRGKDPRDAHFITSRICGICGDNHATCSVYAQNMAYGVKPPPLAEWIINLGERRRSLCSTTTYSRRTSLGSISARRWSAKPIRVCGPRQKRPRRRTRLLTATGPSQTSCGP